MERVKLVNKILDKCANIPFLIENNYIKCVFSLNDKYELFGESMQPLFNKIFNPTKISKTW